MENTRRSIVLSEKLYILIRQKQVRELSRQDLRKLGDIPKK